MAEITAALVKELREKTGVGMMDCKKALAENNGEREASIDWLRAKGLSKAAKKADRAAAEGIVAVAIDGAQAAVGPRGFRIRYPAGETIACMRQAQRIGQPQGEPHRVVGLKAGHRHGAEQALVQRTVPLLEGDNAVRCEQRIGDQRLVESVHQR